MVTPNKEFTLSLTAQQVHEALVSVNLKIDKSKIVQNLANASVENIPSAKAVADALDIVSGDFSSLGGLAYKNSVNLNSSEVSGSLPVTKGGTGGSNLATAQQNLGIVPETGIQEMINTSIPEITEVDLEGPTVINQLPITRGGTGAGSQSQARLNLGVDSSFQINEKILHSQAKSIGYIWRGYFELGFIITSKGQVGVDPDGNFWEYSGSIFPYSVGSGTVPSEPTFSLVKLNSSETITNEDGSSAQDTYETVKAILIAQGLSGDFGFFVNGFDYVNVGDVCIDTGGKIYTYIGPDAPVKNVVAGTTPTSEDYKLVSFVQEKESRLSFNTVQELKSQTDTTGNVVNLSKYVGSCVRTLGYFVPSDGGGNWGTVKRGTHTEDYGKVFSISPDLYVEMNITNGTATNSKKFGLVGDGVSDDTTQAQRWRDVGGKLRAMKGETYIIKGEMGLLDNCTLDLNGSSWKFETTDNVRNFTLGNNSKITNGSIYQDHTPTTGVSTTTGGRAVGIYGFTDDVINNRNNISGWEASKLKIYGGLGYGGGEVRGIHAILMLGDVSNGVIKQIEIDARGLSNIGIHAEWRSGEFVNSDVNGKVKLPHNIKVSNIKFRNGDLSNNDNGFVVGCSGSYNMSFSIIDARDCFTVAIASMGEAGPSYCTDDQKDLICTGIEFNNVSCPNARGYAAQAFGKANPAFSGTDNIPRGCVTFSDFRVKGKIGGVSNIDGVFISGVRRVNVVNNSKITGFPRYGAYSFNGTLEMNIDKSEISSNGDLGVHYIGDLNEGVFAGGSVTHSDIHSNGKLTTLASNKSGIGLFYAENVKVLFNKFGSGQSSVEGATQLTCVRGLSSVYPKRIQIIGNYRDTSDTGIEYLWFTSREKNPTNDETYKILVSNNMMGGVPNSGTFTTTTDNY